MKQYVFWVVVWFCAYILGAVCGILLQRLF